MLSSKVHPITFFNRIEEEEFTPPNRIQQRGNWRKIIPLIHEAEFPQTGHQKRSQV